MAAVAYIGPASMTTPTVKHQRWDIENWSLRTDTPVIATFQDDTGHETPHLHRSAFHAILEASRSSHRQFDTIVHSTYPYEETIESSERAGWKEIEKTGVQVIRLCTDPETDPRIPRVIVRPKDEWLPHAVSTYSVQPQQDEYGEYQLVNMPGFPTRPLLEELITMHLDGEPNVSIARALNRKGVTPHGASEERWNKQDVAETIANRKLTGLDNVKVSTELNNHGEYTIESKQAIPLQKWNTAQTPKPKAFYKKGHSGMLQTLMTCGVCSAPYQATASTNGENTKYQCQSRITHGAESCPEGKLRSNDIHPQVLEAIASRMTEVPELSIMAGLTVSEFLHHGSRQARLLTTWQHMAIERHHNLWTQWMINHCIRDSNTMPEDRNISKATNAARLALGMMKACQTYDPAEYVRHLDAAFSRKDQEDAATLLSRIVKSITVNPDLMTIQYQTDEAQPSVIHR